jgi:vitamin B12 transporter
MITPDTISTDFFDFSATNSLFVLFIKLFVMKFLQFFFSCFLFSSFFFSSLFAQSLDSIQKLDEVTITSSRFKHFNTGHFYTVIDSATKTTQASSYLGEILSSSSLFQINSYGAGAVSVSARGMGEKRTPVIWNGFNIQNILSTGTDLGQLPSFFFEDVRAQMGGSSALFGSGAAGGVLFLSNKQNFKPGVRGQFLSHTGSYGNYYGAGDISASNGIYSCSLKAYYNEAKNNFPYRAEYTGKQIDTTQSNAQATQYGFMMNNFLRFSSNKLLNLNFWYTKSNKNIAPTLSEVAFNSVADGKQKDEFFAVSAEYCSEIGIANVYVRSGFFNSKLNYEKPSWAQVSDSKANWSINEVEASVNILKYFKFNGGFNFTYEMAKSNSFLLLKERYREAVYSSIKFSHPEMHLAFSVNGRQEIYGGAAVPFTYSLGAEYSPLQFFTLKGNLAKNYRLPSFNDLYYKDSWSEGNPDLKPENGMNYELGLEVKQSVSIAHFGIGANYFLSYMDNWINWAVRTDGIWSVFNIDKARISGIETFLEAGIKTRDYELTGKAMYSYTDAKDRNTQKLIANVPQNKVTFNLQAKYLNTSLLCQFMNVGSRYNNVSNTIKMDSYTTSNVILTQTFRVLGPSLSVDFGVYNLLNKNYMIMNDYPMPRRNFRVGFRIMF